jgi:hypothetical protein
MKKACDGEVAGFSTLSRVLVVLGAPLIGMRIKVAPLDF